MAIILFCLLVPSFRRVSEHLAAQLTQGGAQLQSDPSGRILMSFTQVQTLDVAVFILVVILALLLIVWTVLLMYRASAVACNVGGGWAVGLFTTSILLGEGISKWLIGAFLSADRRSASSQTRFPSARLLGPATAMGSRIPTHILPLIRL